MALKRMRHILSTQDDHHRNLTEDNADHHYNHEEEDDQDEAFSDDDFYFLSTLVSVPLTTQICSAHHSSRSISYFALIICATIATMRTIMRKEKNIKNGAQLMSKIKLRAKKSHQYFFK